MNNYEEYSVALGIRSNMLKHKQAQARKQII